MTRFAALILALAVLGCGRSPSPDLDEPETAGRIRSSRIDLPPLPELVAALSDKDPEIRLAAVVSLEQSGQQASGAVPQLALRLKDESANVRLAAAHALGRLGGGTSIAKAALASASTDPDEDVRAAALRSLARLSKDG